MGKSKDSITLAKDIFNEFLSKADPEAEPLPDDKRVKAKAAGRLVGLKGGAIRSRALYRHRHKQTMKRGAGTRRKKRS